MTRISREGRMVCRLAAGGNRIRTAGPTSESAQRRRRPDVADPQHPTCISNPSCQLNQHICRKWDRRFESGSLQRGVRSELARNDSTFVFRAIAYVEPVIRGGNRKQEAVDPAAEPELGP